MTIYEALQQNKMAFGLMCTDDYTNEEMQAKAKGIGPSAFEIFLEKKWVTPSDRFCSDMTYRLRADYTEQVEDESIQVIKATLKRIIDDLQKIYGNGLTDGSN